MSFLAEIFTCALEQAFGSGLHGSDGPGGRGIRAMTLKGQSPGTNIYFAPQTEAGPPGPAWAPS